MAISCAYIGICQYFSSMLIWQYHQCSVEERDCGNALPPLLAPFRQIELKGRGKGLYCWYWKGPLFHSQYFKEKMPLSSSSSLITWHQHFCQERNINVIVVIYRAPNHKTLGAPQIMTMTLIFLERSADIMLSTNEIFETQTERGDVQYTTILGLISLSSVRIQSLWKEEISISGKLLGPDTTVKWVIL